MDTYRTARDRYRQLPGVEDLTTQQNFNAIELMLDGLATEINGHLELHSQHQTTLELLARGLSELTDVVDELARRSRT